MSELFVYYRVRVGHEADALAIVKAFQATLKQRTPGLAARLLRRPPEPGLAQTWMEIYAMNGSVEGSDIGSGFSADLQRLIDDAAAPLMHCIDGTRHMEVFVPVTKV